MNSEKLRNEFKESGYVFFENLFSKTEIESLRSEIDFAKERLEIASGLNRDGLTFHSNLFQKSAKLQAFLAQKKITKIIESVAKGAIWVRWDQTITKEPGGSPFPWHRDNAYNRLKKEHFQFWIALTDMNETNGGLWVIPKSHCLPKQKHERNGNHWKVETGEKDAFCVNAKPGDVLLFSSRLLHKTEINKSNANRTAYVIEYMLQTDVDPAVSPPFLFVESGNPIILNDHPKSNWFRKKFSLITNSSKGTRWI